MLEVLAAEAVGQRGVNALFIGSCQKRRDGVCDNLGIIALATICLVAVAVVMGLFGLITIIRCRCDGIVEPPLVVWKYPMTTAVNISLIVIATWLAFNATLLAVGLWRAYLKGHQAEHRGWEVADEYHS